MPERMEWAVGCVKGCTTKIRRVASIAECKFSPGVLEVYVISFRPFQENDGNMSASAALERFILMITLLFYDYLPGSLSCITRYCPFPYDINKITTGKVIMFTDTKSSQLGAGDGVNVGR